MDFLLFLLAGFVILVLLLQLVKLRKVGNRRLLLNLRPRFRLRKVMLAHNDKIHSIISLLLVAQ